MTKNRLSELIGLVEAGQEINISRRGKVVARLVSALPPTESSQRATVLDTLRQLRRLRSTVELDGNLKAIARDGLA